MSRSLKKHAELMSDMFLASQKSFIDEKFKTVIKIIDSLI